MRIFNVCAALAIATAALMPLPSSATGYQIFITNERSGDVTVINGQDFSVVATVPVGKRPRGIHVSPDGKTVYVAVSGTPLGAPPQIDAHGNPIFDRKKAADEDDDANADKAADGIAVIDVATRAVTGKLNGGSDPEEFALSQDGKQIYISNEDTKSASVIGVAGAKVEHIIPVGSEPEGVTTRPDGKQFYVTCEAGGDIYVVDTATFKAVSHFKVNGRPRSVAFDSHSAIAFIPSESAGELNVVDVASASISKTIALPPGSRPMKVWLSPDDSKVYLTNGRAGTVSVLDARSSALLQTIKVGTRPWGIGFSPDGKYLFTANGPSNDVSVVDLARHEEVQRVKAGSSPWGVAIVPVH